MTSNGTAVDTRSRVLSWIALGVVYLVWGSTYLAIRVGVGHLPPLLFAGIRYVIAGALLYPIALRAATGSRGSAKGMAKPGARAWFAGAVIGVLLLFAGNGGVTIGETTLPSGFAAVLVATVPIWMILFAWPIQHQRVTLRPAVALAVGLGGVIILVGDGTASGRISGVIIVLGAAAAWGFGSVLSHRLAVPSHAMLAAAIEMIVGGVVLLAVGAGSGEFSRIQWSSVPATSWIALGYLIGPGSILAFTAYGYALSHLPLTTVSTYAYVNPVVAVLAGIVFLGEQFTWREGLGAALVLASVIITLHRSRSTSRPAPARDGDMPEAELSQGEHRAAQPALTVRPLQAPTPIRSQAEKLCHYRLDDGVWVHLQVGSRSGAPLRPAAVQAAGVAQQRRRHLRRETRARVPVPVAPADEPACPGDSRTPPSCERKSSRQIRMPFACPLDWVWTTPSRRPAEAQVVLSDLAAGGFTDDVEVADVSRGRPGKATASPATGRIQQFQSTGLKWDGTARLAQKP